MFATSIITTWRNEFIGKPKPFNRVASNIIYIQFEWVFIVTKQKHSLAVFKLNKHTNKQKLYALVHTYGDT